ncbi:MAG: hypothetical protein K2Z81_10490, partial [Cyanobacteria bacterium]|nr:hypothetical protein [Cyanobacteriota bacterium]
QKKVAAQEPSEEAPEVTTKSGITLGTGRAGQLYILCPTTQGPMLCRGSVYTYYEMPGGPIAPVHWERKLQYGLLRAPEWARRFDIAQDSHLHSSANPAR